MQGIFSAGLKPKTIFTSSVLLLTCALSGCDLPGGNAQQAKSDPSAANAQPDGWRNEPVNPSLNTKLNLAAIDKGDEPTPIELVQHPFCNFHSDNLRRFPRWRHSP
jgi:hypothetical protein